MGASNAPQGGKKESGEGDSAAAKDADASKNVAAEGKENAFSAESTAANAAAAVIERHEKIAARLRGRRG